MWGQCDTLVLADDILSQFTIQSWLLTKYAIDYTTNLRIGVDVDVVLAIMGFMATCLPDTNSPSWKRYSCNPVVNTFITHWA